MNTSLKSIYLTSFQRQMLEENLQQDLSKSFRQRLEIIMLTDLGKTQAEICRTVGCCTSTASRWIQFTKAGLAHKYLECPVGRPKVVTDEYVELLNELLQHSPKDYGYSFKTWTVNWLSKHIAKAIGIKVSESHLKRVMSDLGLSTRSKANSEKQMQTSAGIVIADLRGNGDESARTRYKPHSELAEVNLFQLKPDSQIHGAANSFTAYFSAATHRNSWCERQLCGVSVLP
jgi:transposase